MTEKRNKIDFSAEVSKTAELVLQNYSLDSRIRKIFDLLIAEAKKNGYIQQENIYRVGDLAEYLSISKNSAYTELRLLSDKMQKELVECVTIDENGEAIVEIESFVSKSTYKEGKLILRLSDTTLKRLSNGIPVANYTLGQGRRIQESHYMRLFEIFCGLADENGNIYIEIEYLREKMKLINKYKTTKDFTAYIIDRARKVLAEHMDFHFSYTKEKTGRKYTHIRAKIKDKFKDFITQKFVCLSMENARKLLYYGVKRSIILQLDKKKLLTHDRVSRNIAYSLEYQKKHIVSGLGGLIVKAIREDWGVKSGYVIDQDKIQEDKQKDAQERQKLKLEYQKKAQELQVKYKEELEIRFDSFLAKNDAPAFIEEVKKHGNPMITKKLHKVPAGLDPLENTQAKVLCRLYYTKNHLPPEFASFEVWADHFHDFKVQTRWKKALTLFLPDWTSWDYNF